MSFKARQRQATSNPNPFSIDRNTTDLVSLTSTRSSLKWCYEYTFGLVVLEGFS